MQSGPPHHRHRRLALDEITRNKLDSDLLRLWREQGLTVVFVTHSIHEAVFLSQRVIMMAARPGRVVEDIAINEPFPRNDDFRVSPAFSRYAKQLQDIIFHEQHEFDLLRQLGFQMRE